MRVPWGVCHGSVGLGAGFQCGCVKEEWERSGSGQIPMASLFRATILNPAVLGLNITSVKQALCNCAIDRLEEREEPDKVCVCGGSLLNSIVLCLI